VEDFLVVYAILTTSFYFFDRLYVSKEVLTLLRLFLLISAAVVLGIPKKVNVSLLGLFCFYLIGNIGTVMSPVMPLASKLYFSGILLLLALWVFRPTPVQLKNAIEKFVTIFCLLNSLSLVFWALILFNVSVPYEVVHLGGREHLSYRNYFWAAIFCDWTIFSWQGFTVSRNGGLFEEPGMLGTYCALLLALMAMFQVNGLKRKIILVSLGLTSFSLAFLILWALVLLNTLKVNVKTISLSLFSLGTLFFISMPYHFIFANMVLVRIGQDGNLLGSSRLDDEFRFANYIEIADWIRLLAGNGIGSNMLLEEGRYSGYPSLVFEYGLIGSLLLATLLIWRFLLIPLRRAGSSLMILTLVPLLSLYQRPDFASGIVLFFWISLLRGENFELFRNLGKTVNAS
jgi:hypothetical protein